MYETNEMQYEHIQELCYRTNVPVDEFYELLEKMGRTPEQHLAILSDLEKAIEADDIGD